MALQTRLDVHDFVLGESEDRHIHHHLASLEQRLVHRPEPAAELVLRRQGVPARIEADLRVRLGPLGPQLVSHRTAPTADAAARLAISDVERQLERRTARQRGEHTYGVPSRRLPAQLRPNPPNRTEVTNGD